MSNCREFKQRTRLKKRVKNDPKAVENWWKLLTKGLDPERAKWLFGQEEWSTTLNKLEDSLIDDQTNKINDLKNQWKLGDATREGYNFSMQIDTWGRSGNMKQIIDFEVRDGNVYGSTSNTSREWMPFDSFYETMAQLGQ